jgi:hypothetical protein
MTRGVAALASLGLPMMLAACNNNAVDNDGISAADDWVSATDAEDRDTGTGDGGTGDDEGDGNGGDGNGGDGGGDACTEYGPNNAYFHACAEDMPDDLLGTTYRAGQTAKNFTMVDQNGDDVELYQFYGQVIVLDLFASW